MKKISSMKFELKQGKAIPAALATVFLLALAWNFSEVATNAENDRAYLTLAGEQRVLSQSIVKDAVEASSANVAAFQSLKRTRDQFDANLKKLNAGDKATGLPATGGSPKNALSAVEKSWKDVRGQADAILEAEGTIRMLSEFIRAINEAMPNMLAQSDEVVSVMIETGASSSQVYVAARQLMLIPRISVNANQILAGGEEAAAAADRFGRDAALFGRVLEGMLEGNRRMNITKVRDPDAVQKLNEVKKVFETVRDLVNRVLEQTPELFKAQKASAEMLAGSDKLLKETTALMNAYTSQEGERFASTETGLLFGALTVLSLAWLFFVIWSDTRATLERTRLQNERNQQAIMRLLDEIGDLAAGDLTVQATVTEDITGAIADAINYAIDALRRLVSTINETTVQVSSAAQETQATAMHLAEASDHQAQQITAASTAINEMAISIDHVSKNAEESSRVAAQSVQIAKKGTTAVQDTIRGMDTIREQIQETAKRIKRLGESSQEIGDIIELINDIADQTNILALNAAIQAAMAGEAGRGFAVVADEVQRLAERSTDATKQIEALVRTIQSDTNEAVASMEQSTANVVRGAQLAVRAGDALEEIEKVSVNLADLNQSISDAAQQQAGAASSISDSMNVIQEVTTQTSAGTNETSASVGNLADLSNELRRSVSGFKLPD